ncbi:hypothetical protein EPA93_25160 [Ktedonosporobacter rubrisoli]|uniref:ABC transporter permease n=1 Tax=Ktedonosporobacter rubrisoli TaxID=2509675 RepID=A0A4P6JUE5_KTERU|nr:ABC transporter permease [Ktedonosporobacter rubrisoli]QBD79094.1 hypothetical protein EPA93_25160 [Ktedonosporobacter rubrisoli]
MIFFSLLTKELRLRMRRERTIWVIVAYIAAMSLLGVFFVSSLSSYTYGGSGLSNVGVQLYVLLSQVQLVLIVFVTPAFTATVVNGEKERQTFDLLLCSRLSSFALVAGKLAAGITNTLLLIAASIPLFSLVFFFGGVSPTQVFCTLTVFVVTALVVGTFGLLCSTLFKRPAISTAVAYLGGILWLVLPLLVALILTWTNSTWFQLYPDRSKLLFAWNPLLALSSTYAQTSDAFPYVFRLSGVLSLGILSLARGASSYMLGKAVLPLWLVYSLLSLLVTVIFFLLCLLTIKPRSLLRWRSRRLISTP